MGTRESDDTGGAQRRRCLPLCPSGGGEVRQGAASIRARCRADGGPERGLAAQPLAGAVQWRRCISHCTDRSAGGCAARHTLVTARVRACGGLDAAEAAPRRCAAWRSRGRWWRGPAARATARPCRISAVPAGPLPAAGPGVPGTPLGRAPRHTGHRAAPAAGSAGEGSSALLPGRTAAVVVAPVAVPHNSELSTSAGENVAHWRVNSCPSRG